MWLGHSVKKYELGFEQVNKGKGLVKKCYKNIRSKNGPGWAAVFCAANTLVSKDPAQCISGIQSSINCLTCLSDIEDFGWPYAINKWDSTKSSGYTPGPTCLAANLLPPDLTECQRGIRVQYLLNGVWTTYKAIPQGYTLCRSSGGFNSIDDAPLFENLMRFTECGLPNDIPAGTCPDLTADKCNSEDGWTVSLTTTTSSNTPELGIVNLVTGGQLICSPTLYPGNPKGCFTETLNVCPSCSGNCKPTSTYVGPCGLATDDTCMTCLNPLAGLTG